MDQKLEIHEDDLQEANEIIEAISAENVVRNQDTMNDLKAPPATNPVPDASVQTTHHQFWGSQPVPSIDDIQGKTEEGPIDVKEDVSQVKQEPYKMPPAFYWDTLDVKNKSVLKDVFDLLNQNYVEDDDSIFRFAYGEDFLIWALTPPGYVKDWHVGVRSQDSGKLLALITGIPATVQVKGKTLKIAEINFLCVHKALRSKRLAPVLIREITRRVNLQGRWQAVYTAGVELPSPIAHAKYFHRPLNIKKLVECRFSYLSPKMTMPRAQKIYKLSPIETEFRKMENKDAGKVLELLQEHLATKSLSPIFETEADVLHFFLPKDKVIYSYVKVTDKKVTDFLSFYALPSSVIKKTAGHDCVNAAYCYYYVANSVSTEQLLSTSLNFAHQEGFDVFNALEVDKNEEAILKGLDFGLGDGTLHFYIYNWKCASIDKKDLGLVLL